MSEQPACDEIPEQATECPVVGEPTPAARWVAAVAAIARSEVDVKNVESWAICLKMAPATLRRRCRAAGILPKDSLLMGRMVRSLLRGDAKNWRPEDVLDVVDDRTLLSVLRRASLIQFWHRERPPVAVLFTSNPLNIAHEPLQMLARALTGLGDPFL